MLEKKTYIDKIEITSINTIQVCVRIAVLEDSVELSSALHRHVISPGDDYSSEDPKVQAVCAVIHTPDVIQAYQSAQIEA